MSDSQDKIPPADATDSESPTKIEVEIPEEVVAATEKPADTDAELQDAEQRVLRAQAELENFRRRSRRELQESLKFANQDLMKDLLPVIDNLSRAATAAADNPEAKSLLEGVEMVAQQMLETLGKHGCERVSPTGAPFDPNVHEAISQAPSEDVESGSVVQCVQDGYTLHGRVLRPAHVIVSTGAPGKDA